MNRPSSSWSSTSLAVAEHRFWRILAGLVLFSIAFGYLEAAVVAYLRSIYAPMRAHFFPRIPSTELFPLLSLDQLRAFGPEHIARVRIELGREFATLLMLAGAALAATRKARTWVAAFVLCFGVWDIAFYASLKLLLHWPASLLTWDILFLLPVPWVGPVLAPILVSVSMIVAGLIVLWREESGTPVHISGSRWLFIVLGGVIIVLAFIYDFRATAAGAQPHAFNWALFLAGEAIGLAAFATAVRRK